MLWGEKKKLSSGSVCFHTFFIKSMLNFSRLLANWADITCGSKEDSLLLGKHLRNCSDLSDWSDGDTRAHSARIRQHIRYILWKQKTNSINLLVTVIIHYPKESADFINMIKEWLMWNSKISCNGKISWIFFSEENQ